MSSIEELETRAGCKVTRTKKYKEADDADIDALFAKVMKECGDKLAECMCDDRQKVAALAATCVDASDASKSWLLLGHSNGTSNAQQGHLEGTARANQGISRAFQGQLYPICTRKKVRARRETGESE